MCCLISPYFATYQFTLEWGTKKCTENFSHTVKIDASKLED